MSVSTFKTAVIILFIYLHVIKYCLQSSGYDAIFIICKWWYPISYSICFTWTLNKIDLQLNIPVSIQYSLKTALLLRCPWNTEISKWNKYCYFTHWNKAFISRCYVTVSMSPYSKISLSVPQWKFFLCLIGLIWFTVFNATFSNISAISWRPVLVMEEAGVPERTIDHGQATGKLYNLRLRVECTLFCNLQKPGANPRCIGDRLVWVVR